MQQWEPRFLRSGGGHYNAESKGDGEWRGDVWASADGKTWAQVTARAGYSARSALQAVSNNLLVMGGWNAAGLHNDVWRSTTGGATWAELTPSAPWAPRWWFSAVVDGGAVFVLGGLDAAGADLGDVWRLDLATLEDDDARTPYSIVPVRGTSSKPGASLLCLQGTQGQVTLRLRQLQHGALAALWHGAAVFADACAGRGYASGGAADECFPELDLWYAPLTLPAYPGVPQTDRANLYQYGMIVTGVLVGRDFNLHQANGTSAKTVCKRNFTSPSASAGVFAPRPAAAPYPSAANSSGGGPQQMGSHVPDAGLLCNEGPLTGSYTIHDMVATLKNGSLAAIQQLDGVEPVPCAQRGFAVSQGKPDHCYPPAVLWYTGNVFELYKAEWLETGAEIAFDHDLHQPVGTAIKIAACDCRAGSAVRKSLPAGYCSGGEAV